MYLASYPSIYLYVCMYIYLSVCLSICLYDYMYVGCVCVCVCVCVSILIFKNLNITFFMPNSSQSKMQHTVSIFEKPKQNIHFKSRSVRYYTYIMNLLGFFHSHPSNRKYVY